MSGFRTKLDYSNNRQIKQFEKTNTILSGGTTFGLPFSALTSGPDLETTGTTDSYAYVLSTFSGNNTTTNFTWADSNMILAESAISAITPSTSAVTQETGQFFTGNTQSSLDGNSFYIDYSGVSFDLSVNYLIDLGGGNYSGTVEHSYVDFLSASSLDYQSRTIWIDNPEITRTDRLIITRNPQVGYVWTCIDSEGMGEWQYNGTGSTTTIWTAGTGTNSAVLGGSNNIASGNYSVAEGSGNIASGNYSHVEGSGNTASGHYSHAEGTISSGDAIGGTRAIGIGSHAEGGTTSASGNYSHAEGMFSVSSGIGSHAEGYSTTASAIYTHSEGNLTKASREAAHSEGKQTTASGNYSHAEGYKAVAANTASHAEGYETAASGYSSHAEGRLTKAIGGYGSHAEGYSTTAIADGSHAEGYSTTTIGDYSHAEGYVSKTGFYALGINNMTSTLITISNNFDYSSYFTGDTIVTDVGVFTYTSTAYDTPFPGDFTIYISNNYDAITTGTRVAPIEYMNNSAFDDITNGKGGWYSHAEGQYTQAVGYASHAEGNSTTALGNYSHAEGSGTTTIGNSSHAGGYSSEAFGKYSFVHGENSKASNTNTVVFGKNITGTSENTVYVPNLIINTGGTSSRLGINTSTPEYLIDARGHLNNRFFYYPEFANNSGTLTMSATTGLPTIGVFTYSGTVSQSGGISIGMRAWTDTVWDAYGKQGDAHVYSSKQSNGLVLISSDGINTEDYIKCYVGGDADGSGVLAIHMHGTGSTKGYVGFNTDLPTQQIDVNGNGRFRSIDSSASAGALHYTANGTLTTNTSDIRLKTNIETLTNALDKVKQLRGVTYNWKEEPNGDIRIGFIAQEVNEIIPELTFVNNNTEEKYMGVHYDNVVALLVEAIKELTNEDGKTYLKTQTILAEDNNIDLNYNGTKESSVGGGLRILNAKGDGSHSELITDENGDFITNNDFKPNSLTIPRYTPTSSEDKNGSEGNITRDDEYLYIKNSTGWMRTKLESF